MSGSATRFMARLRHQIARGRHVFMTWIERGVIRRTVGDVVQRIARRDAEAAGGVLGAAVAFRIFLFIAPLLLALVGVLGFLASAVSVDDFVDGVGLTGQLARQVGTAFEQSGTASSLVLFTGLYGTVVAGRSLTRVLVVASARAWDLPVARTRMSIRAVGAVIGLMTTLVLISATVNKVRALAGVGLATTSLIAAFALYGAVWFVLSSLLPHGESDATAQVPGAVLVGMTLSFLQWVMQLYLPQRLSRASSLYGSLGAALATLGVLLLLGRILVVAKVVDAVIWDRFGSIGQWLFRLPGLRSLAVRFPRLAPPARSEHDAGREPPSDPDGTDGTGADTVT